MIIDRRSLLGGLAAVGLVTPLRAYTAGVTDATGRSFAALDHVTRIYPAGPPAAVTIYTLAPDLLLGWLEPIEPPAREFLLPEIAARPKVPRLTGQGGDGVNLDAIKTLKAELIVDIGNVGASFASLAERVQQQSGVPYVLLDGHFNKMAASYRTLGQMIGRVDAAEALARSAETTIATVTRRCAAVPPDARPRIYYARDKSGLQTGLGGSMMSEPIEFIGARNVAADLHGSHGAVTIEQVRAWDPEIIIAGDKEFAASVRGDADWSAIAAVKSSRVYLAPRLPFGWVDFPPAVNRLIGLWWLGRTLYPDRFPEDMKGLARDFYTTFYHVTPTAEQIERVLAGSS